MYITEVHYEDGGSCNWFGIVSSDNDILPPEN